MVVVLIVYYSFKVVMSGYRVDAKVVLLGCQFCGKTSLAERYLHARFTGDDQPYQNTVGAAFGARRVEVSCTER